MSTNSTPERRARMATTGRFVKPQEPMTQEQLDAIQGRVSNVEFPDNEHLTVVHGKENLVSWVERSRLDGSVVSDAVVATVHAGPQSAELFAHAPQDLADLLAEVERLRALTTVDDDMVERAARAYFEDPIPSVDASLRPKWDPLVAAYPGVADNYRRHMRAALDVALGTGEGA